MPFPRLPHPLRLPVCPSATRLHVYASLRLPLPPPPVSVRPSHLLAAHADCRHATTSTCLTRGAPIGRALSPSLLPSLPLLSTSDCLYLWRRCGEHAANTTLSQPGSMTRPLSGDPQRERSCGTETGLSVSECNYAFTCIARLRERGFIGHLSFDV